MVASQDINEYWYWKCRFYNERNALKRSSCMGHSQTKCHERKCWDHFLFVVFLRVWKWALELCSFSWKKAFSSVSDQLKLKRIGLFFLFYFGLVFRLFRNFLLVLLLFLSVFVVAFVCMFVLLIFLILYTCFTLIIQLISPEKYLARLYIYKRPFSN